MPHTHYKHTAALLLTLGLALGTQAQTTPFYPNDPYFDPYAADLPGDYPGQWHLYNQMPVQQGGNSGLDINILGAWQMGYTGKGVIIGIVDDGVDSLNPDLSPAFHNTYSWDFALSRKQNLASANRGSPRLPDDAHGTSVAGIAAATGGNGIGVSGVAPAAGIASLAILNRSNAALDFDQMETAAVLFQGQTGTDGRPDPLAAPDWSQGALVRVKNHSYATTGSYLTTGEQTLQAFEESMGHNVIHVFGAANNRTPESTGTWENNIDTGKLDTPNLPGIITVTSIGHDGKFASYSNYGSNVFVAAPGANLAPGGFMINTTDRTGTAGYNHEVQGEADPFFDPSYAGAGVQDYTSTFYGTSAAAPVVSGVMALGVEADPNLNARTAQHILARTSRIIDPNDSTREGGWVVNTANYAFNRNYGFGLIDATAFVQMAAAHGYATEQTVHHSPELIVKESFSETLAAIVTSYNAQIPVEFIQPVEYVSVHIRLTGLETDLDIYGTGTGDGVGSIAGDFEAWLTSPGGTRQMLFTDDRVLLDGYASQRSHLSDDELDWEFLSYAYWGEDPIGEWILELINNTGNIPTGTWETVAFTIGMGDYMIPEPLTTALVFGFASLALTAWWRRRQVATCERFQRNRR